MAKRKPRQSLQAIHVMLRPQEVKALEDLENNWGFIGTAAAVRYALTFTVAKLKEKNAQQGDKDDGTL